MITDELRKYATVAWEPWAAARDRLLQMCDRIDAEYEDAVRKKAARMLTKTSEYMNDDDLAEIGLVRLPVDADGVPIHVGDEVVCVNKRWTVTGLRLTGGFWGVCCTIFNGQGGSGTNVYPPDSLTHYNPPTVEDVLREFARECLTYATNVDDHEVVDDIEKYAERLQLKESE